MLNVQGIADERSFLSSLMGELGCWWDFVPLVLFIYVGIPLFLLQLFLLFAAVFSTTDTEKVQATYG
jgi:hypothetical protein